ncbi:suppressor of ftsI [Mesocricetibacter intestinalis]|uniref:Cell division protein FtsP n=1 Tax=Mesocricetibacter intestinalis TaxID=1521930 RepID=A0A4R6VBF5_9PAST|nr:multicopper oxidase domain-containing protein [Mesocricetibacter intestinalis]TDQ59598.1 suppressor of ftsI [Mesocricetibacter intestinalis]
MIDYSRRKLFRNALFATALGAMPAPLLAAARQALFIPPLLESRRGKPVFLGMESTQKKLAGNEPAEVWGFNGQYLGPTVRVRQGDFVKLNYRNNLSHTVAMNIQGLQVSGELLGGIGHPIRPGQGWAPILPITQSAATCYYQACTLANSAYQNYRGLVGMWIIEDEYSRKMQIPNRYGVNDIPLILQDQKINSKGVQLFRQDEGRFYGERLFVNGQEAPYLSVPRGWVRLRILNASLSRGYALGFEDQRECLIIAADQGFLPQSKGVKNFFVGPGERIEVLVDMNEGGNVSLLAGAKRGFLDKARLFFDSNGELADNNVLELRPEGLLSAFHQKPLLQVPNTAVLPTNVVREREFYLDTLNGMINQKYFDPRRIDVAVKQGTVERWILTASSPVGFRIQGAKFVLERRGGKPVEAAELVWKDSLWIEGEMQILVRFDNLSSNMRPFIFGASDLMLADRGAIGLLLVQ